MLLLLAQTGAATNRLMNSAPAQQEPQRLEPNKPVEREILGGEFHTYQITLQAGQFVRFRLQQQTVDTVLILSASDGKQLVEMDMANAGETESLSLEVASSASYQIIVRDNGAEVQRGSYRLEAAVQATAAALRSAQVEMWKQKRWQSPYYWAAFTLQGEWK